MPLLKISIITQEDSFVIPRNVEMLLNDNNVDVVSIYTIEGKGSFTNKLGYFIKGFGFFQSFKMGVHLITSKVLNKLDLIFGGKLFKTKRSIKAVAEKHRVPYCVLPNLKSQKVLDELRSHSPDLIISFSAPCIFPPELLALPPKGCINLHCSLLPLYAGLLPSFWTLYCAEKEGGATVHYMDDRIDNGGILGQVRVDISDSPSMYQSIQRTKKAGGQLMIQTITKIADNTITVTPNDSSQGSYYTWPTIEQMREFRKKGGRLI